MTSSKLLLSSYWSTVEEKYNITQPFGDTIFVRTTFTPPHLTRIQRNYQKSPLSPSSDWLNQRLKISFFFSISRVFLFNNAQQMCGFREPFYYDSKKGVPEQILLSRRKAQVKIHYARHYETQYRNFSSFLRVWFLSAT